MTCGRTNLSPNLEAIRRHLVWACSSAAIGSPELRLEISWGEPDDGPNRSRTYSVAEIADAAGFAAWINRRGCNVYVGATLKSPDAPAKGRTSAAQSVLATCLPIDVDDGLIAVARQVALVARPQLLVLTGTRPQLRGQLFVRIEPTLDLDGWDEVHGRLVRYCGGDTNALGRNRLTRLAGTVSYPSHAKADRGYIEELTSAYFSPAPQ